MHAPMLSTLVRRTRSLAVAVVLAVASAPAFAQDITTLVRAFDSASTPEAKREAAMRIFQNYGEYKKMVVDKAGSAVRDEAFARTARAIDEQMVDMTKQVWRDVGVRSGNGVTHVVPVGTLGNRQSNPNYIPGKSDKDFIPMGPRAGEAAKDFQNAFERKFGIKPESLDINVLDPTDPTSWKGRVEAVANPEKYNTRGGNKWLQQDLYNNDRNVWRLDPDSGSIAEKNIREVLGEPPKMTKADAAGFFSDNTRFRHHYGELSDPAERILKQSKYDLRNMDAYTLAGGKPTAAERGLMEAAEMARKGNMSDALDRYARLMGLDPADKAAVMSSYLRDMDTFTEKMGRQVVSSAMDDAVRLGAKSGAAKAELAGVIANLPKDMADKLGKQFAGDLAQAEIWKQANAAAQSLKKGAFIAGEFDRAALGKYGKYYDELTPAERLALHGAADDVAGFWSKAGKATGITLTAAAAIYSVYEAYQSGAKAGGTSLGVASAGGRAIVDLVQMGYPPLVAAELIGRLAAFGVGYVVDAQKQDVLDKLYEAYKSGKSIDDVLYDAEFTKYFPAGLRTFRDQIREAAAAEGRTLTDAQVEQAIRNYFTNRRETERNAELVEKELAWARAWVNSRGIPLVAGNWDDGGNDALSEEDLRKALAGVVQNRLAIEDRLRADGVPFTKAFVQHMLYLKYRGKPGDFEEAMAKHYAEYGKTYPPGAKKKKKVGEKLLGPDKQTTDTRTTTGVATIKGTKGGATVIPAELPTRPGWVSARQTLWSGGGSFKERGVDEGCDPGQSFGPFPVATGGRLTGAVKGTPPVPARWSLGNWNTSMRVDYEPALGKKFGPGTNLLSLSGQANDSDLSGTATWGGPGRIHVHIGAPRGSGPLSGNCFGQGWQGSVTVTDILMEMPARSGDTLKPRDRVRTDPWGQVSGNTADGSRFNQGPNTETTFGRAPDGTPRIEVNGMGGNGNVRVQHPKGRPGGTSVKSGDYTARPRGTEYLVFMDRGTTHVAVIEGEVDIDSTTGTVATVRAGEKIALPSCAVSPYDKAGDDGGAMDGVALRDALFVDTGRQPYGAFPVAVEDGLLTAGWTLLDPGDDATTAPLDDGGLRVVVPPGNDFWAGNITAPRLMHKTTGDFTLEGSIDVLTTATNNALSQFVIHAPGSYAGYLDGQFAEQGSAAHYRAMGCARGPIEGKDRISTLARTTIASWPEAPGGPVLVRMTRRGNLFKSFWSTDEGQTWMLSARSVLDLPETILVGWVFQRAAHDRLNDVVAEFHLRDAVLRTAPGDSLPETEWDVYGDGGTASASGDTVDLTLDGDTYGAFRADTGTPLAGDFDLVVRYQIDRWAAEPRATSAFSVAVHAGTDADYAYVGRAKPVNEPDRVRSHLAVNKAWGRHTWRNCEDRSGYLRLTRHGDEFAAWQWQEGRWVRADDAFQRGFTDPVHIGFAVNNNENAQTTSPLGVRFEVEHLSSGRLTTDTVPWSPADTGLLVPAPLPAELVLPEGVDAMCFEAPFPLGNVFAGRDGRAFVFSARNDARHLIEVSALGAVRDHSTTDIVGGTNHKAGLDLGDRLLLAVDHWPGGGSHARGIYELFPGGEYINWPLTERDLGGLSAIVEGPDDTFLVADFEAENVFSVPRDGGKPEPLVTKGEMLYGIISLVRDDSGRLFALNVNDGGACWGKVGIFEIADGEARPVVELPEKKQSASMVRVDSGPMPRGFYVSDPTSGTILRVGARGIEPVIAGLPMCVRMAWDSPTSALWVVFGDNKLLRVAPEQDTPAPGATGRDDDRLAAPPAPPQPPAPPSVTPEPATAPAPPAESETTRIPVDRTSAAAAPPAGNPVVPPGASTVAPHPLARFAGKWALDNADPENSELTFRVRGNRLIGDTPMGPDRLTLRVGDKPGVLVGTGKDENDRDIPATLELTSGGNRLILELAPPQSEFITVTARRVGGGKPDSGGGTDAVAAAEAAVEAAKAKLRKALESEDSAALDEATAELAKARKALTEATGSAGTPPADDGATVRDTTPSRETPAPPSTTTRRPVTSEEEAIERVAALPDVRNWTRAVEASARRSRERHVARFQAHEEGRKYVVHVFEDVGDEDEGHTATFGWFEVDKATGRATPQDEF